MQQIQAAVVAKLRPRKVKPAPAVKPRQQRRQSAKAAGPSVAAGAAQAKPFNYRDPARDVSFKEIYDVSLKQLEEERAAAGEVPLTETGLTHAQGTSSVMWRGC